MIQNPAHSPSPRPNLLTIAGFDPSSGAGITADLKVFASHQVIGLAAITALTVQSTQGVRRVDPVSPDTLRQTLDCLAEDLPISGVKIGMLATAPVVDVVADFLGNSGIPTARIVLDPVLESSSGRALLSGDGINLLKKRLLPLAGWVTPNLAELSILAGFEVSGRDSVPAVTAGLAARFPNLNIVVTGGHLDPPDDFLHTAQGVQQWFPGQRIETRSTHGTGCAFSSALLARLVAGDSAPQAVAAAKSYVAEAMRAAVPLGRGHGPLNHLYKL